MDENEFSERFPREIVDKYKMANAKNHCSVRIGTVVVVVGVHHCEVWVANGMEEKFLSSHRYPGLQGGYEAFHTAVRLAEKRGLPWCVRGESDVFDPKTSERWVIAQPI